MWYILYMETTNDYGMADMLARQKAVDEASREKMINQKKPVVNKPVVEAGRTTIKAESLSVKGQERRIQREGMVGVGRNPEDVVIGEKRQDWDPNR